MAKKEKVEVTELVKTWSVPPRAMLGSAVRAKGILLEIRARLPSAVRKSLDLQSGVLILAMPESARSEFRSAAAIITAAITGIESLPVIPREIQDILTISVTERHRWLKDGRLPSAGTRTVRLNGRARQITFHVFDPDFVEELLDRGTVDEWREEDAITAAENRQRAAWKTKLIRALKKSGKTPGSEGNGDSRPDTGLAGWDEFGADGLLR